MTFSVHPVPDPSVARRPFLPPFSVGVITVLLLRHGLLQFTPVVSRTLNRSEGEVAVDLMTWGAMWAFIGLSAARALGRRAVAERGPAEAERRAVAVHTWASPVLLSVMFLNFLQPFSFSPHLAYFGPLAFAVLAGAAHYHRWSADEALRDDRAPA